MTEAKMHQYMIERYDQLAVMPEVLEYYGQSDFLNFGYWGEGTATQKQACENLMEQLLGFIPEKKGSILDVACGKGATTAYLVRDFPAEGITGINISEKQLEIARMNAPGCTFMVMNATELHFEDNSIDNIICVEAVFHFYTREKFLKEAHRVLKPGGHLVLSDILMSREAEMTNASRTVENYIPDLESYRSLLKRTGFPEHEVIDATTQCWQRHFQYAVDYFHRKFLRGEIDQEFLQLCLQQTYRRAECIQYYLLVNAAKTRNKDVT